MRLIDADNLAKDINSLSTHPLNEWDTMGVLMQIDKQPTVDAIPVRHGHWEIDMRGNWACSLCGNDPYHDNMKNMNYCPNCGAKMDEVRDE